MSNSFLIVSSKNFSYNTIITIFATVIYHVAPMDEIFEKNDNT